MSGWPVIVSSSAYFVVLRYFGKTYMNRSALPDA
jgi:hypothetical protein